MIPQPIDQVPLFQKLTEEEREFLTSRLRHHTYQADEVIFSAGKPPEMLALIVSGWVKLETDSPNGALVVANLGAGNLIGELDCLLKRPHSTTARAASALDLLVLVRSDLEDLLLERPTIALKFSAVLGTRVAYLDDYLVTQRLATQALFSGLSEENLRAVATRLEFRTWTRGETLFEAGSEGNALYLIEAGQVREVCETSEGEEFAEAGEGELLEQQVLVTGKAYASTAFALSDLQCWVLARAAYQDLLKTNPAIKLAFSRALSEKLSGEEQTHAVEQLRRLPLFADLDQNVLRALAARLVLRHYPAGERIYTEGTPGDAIYFVDSGEIRLLADSEQEKFLERKTIGTSFGEMALLTGRTRAEAAVAQTDASLWVLYKNDYDDLLVQHPTLSLALSRALSARLATSEGAFEERHLQHIKLFQGLAQNELREISASIQPAKYRAGEIICYAGQPIACVYLVEGGQVRTLFQNSAGATETLEELGPGDSFGEAALLQNTAQSYTVQAASDVDVWTIRKADFDRLLAQYPTLTLNVTRRVAEQAHKVTERLTQMTAPATTNSDASATAPATPTRVTPTPPARPTSTRPQSPAPQTIVREPAPVAKTNGNGGTNGDTKPVGVRTVPPRPWDKQGGSVVRPMPAAASRQVQLKQDGNATTVQTRSNLARWFSSMSAATKVQIGAIMLLLIVVVCVVLPFAFISVAQNFGGASTTSTSKELPQNIAPGPKQSIGYALKIAQLETSTPTAIPPTKVPPTATPVPTKKPVVIVNNPAPKVNPQQASIAAQATATAVALAAAPKAPPLPPLQWDPRLGPGGLPLLQGIHIEKAVVASGQTFWMVTRVKFQDAGAESGNDHTIYITLLDENGKRVSDANVIVSWSEASGEQIQRLTPSDEKPAGDFCNCNYNWPMYGAGYSVNVDGLPSDQVVGMIMPEHRHVNYLLTFQRLVMP